MRKKILEDNLKRALRKSPAASDEKHLKDTLFQAERELLKKQNRKRISFARFVQRQITYIGWRAWSIQSIFLFAAVGVLSDFTAFMKNPRHLAKLLLCLSVAAFMTALPLLYRPVRYQMQEIEAAARFSSVKLLLARLIIIGIGDLSLLSGIFLTTMMRTSLSADSAFLYLCFPFLLSGCGCLFMLGHLPPRSFLVGSFLFCASLMFVFSVLPERYTFFLQPAFPTVWAVICGLLFGFCGWPLRDIILASSVTETQIV